MNRKEMQGNGNASLHLSVKKAQPSGGVPTYICGQWRKTRLHWWSVKKDPLTLVDSEDGPLTFVVIGENPPYIGGQ